ncbi:MAG: ribose 5-phosphate isomerase B [Sphaerochaeta sp.]
MRGIVIGCDNAAVGLKNEIVSLLKKQDIQVEDVGCFSENDPILYPEVAETVCKKIQDSGFEKKGILICGTGLGMSISANKCKGIYATVCHDTYSAQRSILSNNANVLCLGERVIGYELAKVIVNEWIHLEFIDGRSTEKVQAIHAIEDKNFVKAIV